MESRRNIIVEQINASGPGLEIGPFHSPIFPKSEGYQVKIIDHAPKDELIKIAGDLRINPEHIARIEDVDFVWSGEPYKDLVGAERFEWIFASHVVEHVPDLIGFLNSCADILTDDGVLALAVPDKRYIFDRLRQQSSLASVIDAHLEGHKKPTVGDIIECSLFVSDPHSDEHSKNIVSLLQPPTPELLEQMKSKKDYTDAHVWVFGPSCFRLIVEETHLLGLTKLREVSCGPVRHGEFFIFLSKRGCGPDIDRLTLAKQAIFENSRLDLCKCGKFKKKYEKKIRKYLPKFLQKPLLRLTGELGTKPPF